MNINSVVLITKDALCKDYLPCYGNKYWAGKTPNIDALAKKGIVYSNFYTAAPSSAMSYLSMFTGKYPYQQKIANFEPVKEYSELTLFDKANQLGFETHIIWDEGWMSGAYRYSMCYGKKTKIHALQGLRQGVGAQYIHDGFLKPNNEKSRNSIKMIDEAIHNISRDDNKMFLWIHIPHVINGRVCYGSDIDLFDEIVGVLRRYFDDANIYISADHGNMNGSKGKLGYGFDVYESATKIPLIAPIKNNSRNSNDLMCNIDFFEIMFGENIPEREFVFLDSAYYGQEKRDLGIVKDGYKYIYHKSTRKEELFDLSYDPHEEFNLIDDKTFDVDRKVMIPSREEYFYPKWNDVDEIRNEMRTLKNEIWRDSTISQDAINIVKKVTRPLRTKMMRKKIK